MADSHHLGNRHKSTKNHPILMKFGIHDSRFGTRWQSCDQI